MRREASLSPSLRNKTLPDGKLSGSTFRPVVFAVLALVAILAVLLTVIRLLDRKWLESRFAPRYHVSLDESVVDSDRSFHTDADVRSSLRIAVTAVVSPEKSLGIYKGFVEYLGARLGRESTMLQRRTYGEINSLLRHRRCDIALVCPYPFVKGEREFGLEVLVAPVVDGKLTYHSLILVSRFSQATSLLDLRDRRFVSADILSNSGWLFPAKWLTDRDADPDSFFREHLISGTHDRSIQAVASGYVDGAAVDSLVYAQVVADNPLIAEKTKIILKSPPFGMPPIVVHPQTDPELKARLRAILLSMHEDPEGKAILETLAIERFVVPEKALYDSVREAARIWEIDRGERALEE